MALSCPYGFTREQLILPTVCRCLFHIADLCDFLGSPMTLGVTLRALDIALSRAACRDFDPDIYYIFRLSFDFLVQTNAWMLCAYRISITWKNHGLFLCDLYLGPPWAIASECLAE